MIPYEDDAAVEPVGEPTVEPSVEPTQEAPSLDGE
jgi:hypothetical protein